MPPGAAVFTITFWITLCSMWAAAALADRLLDQRPAHQPCSRPESTCT
jgi:hypothetical protein